VAATNLVLAIRPDAVDLDRPFSMAVSKSGVPTVGLGRLALILERGPNPALTHLAWSEASGFTTLDRILRFSEIVRLPEPVPLPSAMTELSAAQRRDFAKSIKSMERAIALTEAVSNKVRMALRRLVGDSLLQRARPLRARIGGAAGHEIIEDQIDALSTALRCSGMDLTLLDQARPSADQLGVLASLQGATEMHLIAHDARKTWPALPEIPNANIQSHVFNDRGNLLHVMDVNATPVETATGVDLLYYNDRYKSFVGVQYKRAADHDQATLAHLDERFIAQLGRMSAFDSLTASASTSLGYRTLAATTFVKLAHTSATATRTSGLVDGPYIPATYLSHLYEDGELIGPRGGRSITYDNLKRWMPKTVFAEMVQYGWAGSTGVTRDRLDQWISEATAQNRSVIAAVYQPRVGSRIAPRS